MKLQYGEQFTHEETINSMQECRKLLNELKPATYTVFNEKSDIIEMKVNGRYLEKWNGKHCLLIR